jgi:hypothetical protein
MWARHERRMSCNPYAVPTRADLEHERKESSSSATEDAADLDGVELADDQIKSHLGCKAPAEKLVVVPVGCAKGLAGVLAAEA